MDKAPFLSPGAAVEVCGYARLRVRPGVMEGLLSCLIIYEDEGLETQAADLVFGSNSICAG